MGRKVNLEVATDILRTCQELQARADHSGMKFMAQLLGVVMVQAQKEITNPEARLTIVGKSHTANLISRGGISS